jgi:RNA polymerase sigma-70 factor (ECF subfamily)
VKQRSEKALIKRIRAQDQEACVLLVREHHAPIYRLLFHLCRDPHQAEDLVQETFASAWKSLETFNGTSPIGTWLHRIAYRKFLDARRRRPDPGSTADTAIDPIDKRATDPVAMALVDEDSKQLYEALSRLNPDEREVVVLHYLQGMSCQQIAEIIGVPAGTVRWRKSNSLKNLRSLLQEKLEYETD